ncbi:MAG: 3-keto-disaccharide hydrolase, partial [Planctomycetota bacterium]
MKRLIIFCLVLCCVGCSSMQKGGKEGWEDLLASGDMSAFREPTGDWMVVSEATINPDDDGLLSATPGAGTILNGLTGDRAPQLFTKAEYGDIEAHIEFMIPKGSNSGIYFQGRYELQILDSWRVEEPGSGDCGGIYERWEDDKGYDGHAPRTNASREPGQWQSYDVIFRAPRFDEGGNKTENGRFVKVVHNGIVIHEDQEVSGPTRSPAFEEEGPLGPMVFQGDHGPVAYRNIRVRTLKDLK